MKNVLFLYPPQSLNKKGWVTEGLAPPLGLLHLKSMLKGFNVKILDLTISKDPKKDFLEVYNSENWDTIGMTVLTYCLDSVHQLVNYIKENNGSYLLAGGPHATLVPEDCLKVGFDTVIVGEGELIISDIINNHLKGIIQGKPVEDLDKLPFVDRSVLGDDKYGIFGSFNIPGLSTSIMTSRGCPFNCNFCGRIMKGLNRRRSVKNVIDELKLLARQGFENILIADDHFSVNKKWVLSFCKAIKKEKLEFNFFCETRVDSFSKDLAKNLRGINTQLISFGVESIHPEILKFYNKTGNPLRWSKFTKNALKYCNDTGIYSQVSLIIGAPMETEEMFWKSYNLVRKHRADTINANPLTYMVGSEIWRNAVKNGLINENEYIVSVKDKKLCPIDPERIAEISDIVWRGALKNLSRGALFKTITHLDEMRLKMLGTVFRSGIKKIIKSSILGQNWKMAYDVFGEVGYGKRSEDRIVNLQNRRTKPLNSC